MSIPECATQMSNTLFAYGEFKGIDYEEEGADEAVSDLLTDLMHWCDANGVDFYERLAIAKCSHKEELEEYLLHHYNEQDDHGGE